MKNKTIHIISILLFVIHPLFSQTQDKKEFILETAPDSIVFKNYNDSIAKYVYRDSRRIDEYLSLCEDMITHDKELSNANRLDFVLNKIYYQYTLDNTLKVVELIETNKGMLELKGISYKQKKNFKYLDGYTSMVLGNLEAAQTTYYELLNESLDQKDSSITFQALYALGEIYLTQKEYNTAEKYFLDAYELIKKIGKNSGNRVHVYIELVKLYIKKEDFIKAQNFNEIGIHLSDSLKMLDFKFDFLLNQVDILIQRNKIIAARDAYNQSLTFAMKMENSSYEKKCKEEYLQLLGAEKRYNTALINVEKLLEEEEKGQKILPTLLRYYKSAHEFAEKNKKHDKAYQYLLQYNTVKDSLAYEEQLQKTEYAKVKFGVERKEKENTILTAQILQKKTQNQLLYSLAFFSFLLIILLMGNVLQRRNYNKKLKADVKNRTIELEKSNTQLSKSNEELSQFSHILSHDLKEPLRSIVGFSSLAKREVGENKHLAEYLSFINRSGKQLNQLIDDVAIFHQVGNEYGNDNKFVDLNEMMNSILESIRTVLMEKNARVKFSNLPTIYANRSLIFIVFKNLIENGIKYNNSDTPIIHIRYELKDNKHSITFEDNGIGIAAEYHDKVFGMFKRLNDRGTYEGSGLGLNIVKKIMDKVNGDIGILTSEEGRGSVFEVSFVLDEKEENHYYKMDVSSSN